METTECDNCGVKVTRETAHWSDTLVLCKDREGCKARLNKLIAKWDKEEAWQRFQEEG